MTPEQNAARADSARRYIEDPLVQEAFTSISNALHSQWEDSSWKDKEGREAAYYMLKCFNEFKNFFALVISDGDFAKDEIEKKLHKSIRRVK
jgi:hypothetical protein